MASVFEDFRSFWRPPARPTVRAEPTDEELRSELERRSAEISDMRGFVGTLAYARYRKLVEEEIAKNEPTPLLGSDVASCCSFKQAGLRAALGILDKMVVLAQEKTDA